MRKGFGMVASLHILGQFAGGGSRDELFEGLCVEVFENGLLALFPGVMHGAGDALSAGAIFHDALGDTEGAFHGLHCFPERYPAHRSGQPGASAAALFALDQARMSELGHDPGQQAARNPSFG